MDLLLEHFFFRIEIVINKLYPIFRVLRFLKRFPNQFHMTVWENHLKQNPALNPLLFYMQYEEPSLDYNNEELASDSDSECQAPVKRRRSEDSLTTATAKRVCYEDPELHAKSETFKDARDF